MLSSRPETDRLRAHAALAVLLGLLLAWSLWFLWRSSFLFEGERIFPLFDDAMISMAYARNLSEGFGLVWSRHGAPVEGFSHPLWLLPMIGSQLLPLPPGQRTVAVELLSLLLLLLCVLAAHRFAARRLRAGPTWALLAAGLTALYYPLAFWSLSGMATALVALLVLLGADLALGQVEGKERRILPLFGVLTLALLLRLDLALFACLSLAYLALFGAKREERRAWILGAGLLLVSLLGYELFRLAYYGEPLPNTYYLKLSGIPLELRLRRGALVLWKRLDPALVLALGLASWLATKRRWARLPLLLVLGYMAYSVYVGGDSADNLGLSESRFLVPFMPLLFALVASALRELHAQLRSRPEEERARWRKAAGPALGVLLLVSLACHGFGFFMWPKGSNIRLHLRDRVRRLLVDRPPGTTAASYTNLSLIRELERHLPEGSKVAVVWAGVPAYFSDLSLIDYLGYNDHEIAHGPMRLPLRPEEARRYHPGHMKWNLPLLLRRDRPEVFMQLWRSRDDGARALLREAGYRRIRLSLGTCWVRRDVARRSFPWARRELRD